MASVCRCCRLLFGGGAEQNEPLNTDSTVELGTLTPSLLTVPTVDVDNAPIAMTLAQPPPGEPFARSYEENPIGNFGFLVPGDEELFVGGGALNGAVGKLLLKTADQKIPFVLDDQGGYMMVEEEGNKVPLYRKDECLYRRMNERLFSKARTTGFRNKLVVAEPADIGEAPVDFAAARVYSDHTHPFGAGFLSIFKSGHRPYGCDKNVALLYTAGPLGRNKRAPGEGAPDETRAALVCDKAEDFVLEIFLTARNLMKMVIEYNVHIEQMAGLPRIDIVRFPIVSGGTFIHPDVNQMQVALALLWGLHAALRTGLPANRPNVELMPGKAMEDAYKMYYEDKSRPADWSRSQGSSLYSKVAELEEQRVRTFVGHQHGGPSMVF